MTEHLPECAVAVALPGTFLVCICEALRACEERVRSNPDWTSHILLDELERCLALAYKEGLGAGAYDQGQHDALARLDAYLAGCDCPHVDGARAAIKGDQQ